MTTNNTTTLEFPKQAIPIMGGADSVIKGSSEFF